MALSVGPNQNYRLREMRDQAVGRARSEIRSPSRRGREFGEVLNHPKAGEVVGRFPSDFNKAPLRTRPTKMAQVVQRSRQQPRSPVAALMARDGVSTSTKFSRRFSAAFGAKADPQADVKTETVQVQTGAGKSDNKPAWMSLLSDAPTEPVKTPSQHEANEAARVKAMMDKREEIKGADRMLKSLGGFSELERSMKKNDERILREAGKMETKLQSGAGKSSKTSKQDEMMDTMKDQMAMDQQLNMRYLAIQQKLDRSQDELLSNLMSVRDDAVKAAIDGEQ